MATLAFLQGKSKGKLTVNLIYFIFIIYAS